MIPAASPILAPKKPKSTLGILSLVFAILNPLFLWILLRLTETHSRFLIGLIRITQYSWIILWISGISLAIIGIARKRGKIAWSVVGLTLNTLVFCPLLVLFFMIHSNLPTQAALPPRTTNTPVANTNKPANTVAPTPATVSAPEYDLPGGLYTGSPTITITTQTAGASLRYTLDGSNPTSTLGIPYTSPVTIPSSSTLKAIAYKDGWIDSPLSEAAYYTPTVVDRWGENYYIHNLSLAITVEGNPVLAYDFGKNASAEKIRTIYASWNGLSWDYADLPVEMYGNFEPIVQIYRNVPVISYASMRFGHTDTKIYNTAGQTTQVAQTDYQLSRSMAVNAVTGIHIISYSNQSGYLNYAHGLSGQWSSMDIEDIGPDLVSWSFRTSIATDENGDVHACFYNQNQDTLRYAYFDGLTWTITSIFDDPDYGSCAIAAGTDGKIHIAYGTSSNGLVYLIYDGSNWTREELLAPDARLGWNSVPRLILDSNNDAHILYVDHGSLVYTSRGGNNWKILRCEPCVSDGLALALDSDNTAHIMVADRTTAELLYFVIK